MTQAAEAALDLSGFNGTENWYAHSLSRLVFTDGIQWLAEQVGAYWLIDAVASWQSSGRVQAECDGFQLWRLEPLLGPEAGGARLTCRRDTDDEPSAEQKIEYTDFPFTRVQIAGLEVGKNDAGERLYAFEFFVSGPPSQPVMMLKSEY